MKSEFDRYRAAGEPHPLFATAGIDAVPFRHEQLDRWRHNFTGVRWKDDETGWTLFGAVDDLWQAPSGELIVADYKATVAHGDAERAQPLSVVPAADGRLPVPRAPPGIRRQQPRAGSSTRTATAGPPISATSSASRRRSCLMTATTPGCSTCSGARSRRSSRAKSRWRRRTASTARTSRAPRSPHERRAGQCIVVAGAGSGASRYSISAWSSSSSLVSASCRAQTISSRPISGVACSSPRHRASHVLAREEG